MENNKIKFLLDFGGFYHSVHSDKVDSQIEYFDINEDNVDYKATHNNYAIGYLEQLNDELGINLEFIAVNSPRYYNFTTDNIECSISAEEFEVIKNEYLTKDAINCIDEASKSRSGFYSFYNGYDEVKEEAEILANYLFRYILSNEYNSYDFTDFEFEVEVE